MNAIESILKNNYSNMEVVVQDNSDDKSLEQMLQKFLLDKRLVYRYTPPPFSSIDNFNAVLGLASGEYVCLIGDDDGITENIFLLTEWAYKNNVDSICPTKLIHYVWPNDKTNGKMVIPYFSKKIWCNNPLENIQPLIEDGIVQYMKFNLPKLYHGIVKLKLLEEVKTKTGYYIGGLSPDIYASISLSKIVNKHVVIDFPVTIAGASPKSTTIDNTLGKHSGKLENAPHFRDRGDYIWESIVPRFYSVQTIWAETAIKAIKDMEIEVDLSKLNLQKMLAAALIDSNAYEDLFIEEIQKIKPFEYDSFMRDVKKYQKKLKINSLFSRIFNGVPRKYIYRTVRITNIADIDTCTHLSNNELTKRYNLKKILSDFNGKLK
ncbi:hypothetical protein AWM65_02990 [Riemerella anatipestifer]|nr:hypothetical protein AWM65_02990 [Riemerella anatipestifer]